MGIYERVSALVGRATQEFKAQKPFLNTVADQSNVVAYAGNLNRLLTADGSAYSYNASSTLTPIGKFILNATGKGSGRWLLLTDTINVKHFGAVGGGATNDLPACQAAIDYAKALSAISGATLRPNVYFPNAVYRFNSTTSGLNITNANGICLVGGGGKYLATQINGNCSSVIFDFTGTSASGCTGFSFFSDPNETNPAGIGVQFALGDNGLYNYINDCWFQMASQPTRNGGLGTIGLLNIRSEEFNGRNLTIRADSPAVFSNKHQLTTRKASNTVTFGSAYTSINTSTNGSMGVVSITGSTLGAYAGTGHGLTLNGTNTIRFQGYISGEQHPTDSTKAESAAIGCYGPQMNPDWHYTTEGFSTAIYVGSAGKIYNPSIKLVVANVIDKTKPFIEFVGSENMIYGGCIEGLSGNGTAEIGTRPFLYTPPVNSGNSPTTTTLRNVTFNFPDWPDNTTFVTPLLLKQSSNCRFYTNQAFEKETAWVRSLYSFSRVIGTNNNQPSTATLLRFNAADKLDTANSNGGSYTIQIDGVTTVGGAGAAATAFFTSTILIHQTGSGSRRAPITTTTITAKDSGNTSYADISSISANVVWNGTIASIQISVSTTGANNGEVINFDGQVKMMSLFMVNQSCLFE